MVDILMLMFDVIVNDDPNKWTMHNTDFVFLSENTVTETERETVEFSKHIRAWKLVVLIFFFFFTVYAEQRSISWVFFINFTN